ncbi:MAG: antibiotic biosynthesis monooxygenase family protein [Halofilum sp. (in: g-proteobacteria)]|nr:antibiotic biosynthesis monooxygenase family protein [Halofilum sp. (in: g-proteobacteria)]
MFVAMSRFRVRPGQEDMVRDAFGRRPMRVDEQPGFVRMEVLNPEEPSNEFWLITFWEDRDSFERWHRHHLNESHAEMPRGLKVEKGSRALQYFDLVTE